MVKHFFKTVFDTVIAHQNTVLFWFKNDKSSLSLCEIVRHFQFFLNGCYFHIIDFLQQSLYFMNE